MALPRGKGGDAVKLIAKWVFGLIVPVVIGAMLVSAFEGGVGAAFIVTGVWIVLFLVAQK